jgi:hypothetical protein
MAFVAMVALDLWAIRALSELTPDQADYLSVGALPMATILAVGLLIAQQEPRSGPFLCQNNPCRAANAL